MIAVGLGIVSIIFVVQCFGPARNAKKCVRRLTELGLLDTAAQEFENPANDVVGKDKVRLSRQFLFAKGAGIAVRYEDIIRCYKLVITGASAGTSLVIQTNNIKKQALLNGIGPKTDEMIFHTIGVIKEHNPDVAH